MMADIPCGVESQELLENVQVQKMTTHALELMNQLVVDKEFTSGTIVELFHSRSMHSPFHSACRK